MQSLRRSIIWFPASVAMVALGLSTSLTFAQNAPDLLLAKKYAGGRDVSAYWVSEKLDGVRAYWDGQALISRQGNTFNAPQWFVKDFPARALDGELWAGRGKFQTTLSAVSKNQPLDADWGQIQYMLFELPAADGPFSQRLQSLKQIVAQVGSPYLKGVLQYRVSSHDELQERLTEVVAKGGEGLMLHLGAAQYHTGRSDALLKVKMHDDAEATVLAHLEGKGKYTGMLGALLVETPSGLQFKIGSGFSDAERADPPGIGCQVTYRYFGKTKRGVPRFASFMRTAPRNALAHCGVQAGQ